MKYLVFLSIPAFLLGACSEKKLKANEPVAVAKPVLPALVAVGSGGVATELRIPGQLAAYQEVSIFPKVNGYVKTVLVDVGSKVSKGNRLMVLEAPELVEASLKARERYARALSDYSIDKEHYQRLKEAALTAGAISPLDLSSAKAKMEADSSLSNAEKANWEMQKTMLGYLNVTAPFTGVITERNVHPGALVSAVAKDKPMLELKQIDHLRLQVDIPESMANTLKDKDTVSFYVSALQGKRLTGYISRKSMNINSQYRSERMEIDVPNPDAQLAPGMYADVMLYSKGDPKAMYVPRTAVVTSTEKKYVLKVVNGKTQQVEVETGNQSVDKVEIYGNIQPGDQVISVATDETPTGN
ncbi:MAG: efflux RND transporter periplasmic adaptor subunit [Bacteroidota bacterium]|nr:efflux RND transporter periplasmic adaptor subunit [Bacteroidota bacterium]